MTAEATRPLNLLLVASFDWPIPIVADYALAHWHLAANRPHAVLHTLDAIGDPPLAEPIHSKNLTVARAREVWTHQGFHAQNHGIPDAEVSRRAEEMAIHEIISGHEIDHVIALILNDDRVPSTAIMNANLLAVTNTIIRINENGRV